MQRVYIAPIVALVLGIFFCAFSSFLAIDTNGLWFSRSGAILCLFASSAQFYLSHMQHKAIRKIVTSELSKEEKHKKLSYRPIGYKVLFFLSMFAGVVGTLVWAYGDLIYATGS